MSTPEHHETNHVAISARARRGCAVIGLFLLVAGCATDDADRERYVRDGVRYGVTEGRFRGRWWNYYERARSFQDGQFYEESERDLRVALGGRSQDQRWARTYGLHFVAQYFPNRELGITLFYQNRLDEAVEYLERSISQRFSARAAYFLDEARAAWVVARNADAEPPTLDILAPDLSSPLTEYETVLMAVARDDTFVRSIRVGDERVPVRVSSSDVSFTHPLKLEPGTNSIQVYVTDVAGRTSTFEISLAIDVDGPAVSFDEPVVVPGIVRGVAYDPAGIAAMRIANREASLMRQNDGLVAFEIDLARDDLSPPLNFETEDNLGNVTQGLLPLDTLVNATAAGNAVLASNMLVSVGGKFQAVVVGGQIAEITRVAQRVDEPRVEFTNLEAGQRYLMDEIVVAMKLSAPSPVAEVTLNGRPVPNLLPGRRNQRISRRVRLEQEGPNTVVARLQDSDGRSGQGSVTVERELTEVERIDRKLSVALLGNVWSRSNERFEDEAEFILGELRDIFNEGDRFKLVDRDEIGAVLAEQELIAALGEKRARQALGTLVQAELLLVGRLSRSGDILEINLHAIDSNTTEVHIVDVAGRISSPDDLIELVEVLALRLEQEFPRVQGLIIGVNSPTSAISDLNVSQGLRRNMRCIVFRKGEEIVHPRTGAVLGAETIIIAEGVLSDVAEQMTSISLFRDESDDAPLSAEVMDLVLTK